MSVIVMEEKHGNGVPIRGTPKLLNTLIKSAREIAKTRANCPKRDFDVRNARRRENSAQPAVARNLLLLIDSKLPRHVHQ